MTAIRCALLLWILPPRIHVVPGNVRRICDESRSGQHYQQVRKRPDALLRCRFSARYQLRRRQPSAGIRFILASVAKTTQDMDAQGHDRSVQTGL